MIQDNNNPAAHDDIDTADVPPEQSACPAYRWGWWALLLVLALQLASALPRLTGAFRYADITPHDLSQYVTLGKAVAEGHGYTRSLDPDYYVPHTHWPPGYPLMLAACFKVSDSMLCAHVMNLGFALGCSVMFWLVARRYLPVGLRLVAVMMLACSPLFDRMATVPLVEPSALFFMLAAFWSLDGWWRSGYRLNGWVAGAIVSIGWGLLVNPRWIMLLPAFWVFTMLNRRSSVGFVKRTLVAAVLLTVAGAPWLAWGVHSHRTKAPGWDGFGQMESLLTEDKVGGDVKPASEFTRAVWINIKWYVPSRLLDVFFNAAWFLKRYFLVEPNKPVMALAYLGFAACFVAALWWFGRLGFVWMTAVFYPVPFFFFARSGGSPRYWLLWTPFALVVVLTALHALWRRACVNMPLCRWLGPGIVGALCGAGIMTLVVDHQLRPEHGSPDWAAYYEVARQAGRQMPRDAVLVSPWYVGGRLVSGRFRLPGLGPEGGFEGMPVLPGEKETWVILPKPWYLDMSAEAKRKAGYVGGFDNLRASDLPGRLGEAAYENRFFSLHRLHDDAGDDNKQERDDE